MHIVGKSHYVLAPVAAALSALALPAIAAAQADGGRAAPGGSPGVPASTPEPTVAPAAEAGSAAATDARFRALEDEVRALRAERVAAPAPAAAAVPSPFSDADFRPAVTPFAYGDMSWVPGNYAPSDTPLHYGPLTGEVRLDVPYHYSFADPVDDTISGSSEVFRHNEFQVTQIGFGGDFYFKGVQLRLMTQFGMYSQTTPRNDPSAARGQWRLDDAYRYISEAYAGYHLNVLAGINIQAGIFMSYVGLWSYYNFDNWTYQPSYVSSNTPWFFNGMRIQIFPSEKLKIEPWLVNGWQAYGQFNRTPGLGLQIRWAPSDSFVILGNQYYGADTLGVPNRQRIHTDDSVMVRLLDRPDSALLSRLAASLTVDAGCEFGDGVPANGVPAVSCSEQYFLGFMAYARAWFYRNTIGFTVGGGAITNPGRYLVLMPPINGATAFSGTPYFTYNKGDKFTAWDVQTTLDVMPVRNITFRLEFVHRVADVPYFAGHGGVTPPGGNQGSPGSMVMGWSPDLVNSEDRITLALMARL